MILLFSLAACGGIYNSPTVTAETTAVGDVTVAQINAQNLAAANGSPYRPRTLPAIFSRTTGTSGSAVGAGALPAAAFLPEDRPANLPTLLPPPEDPTAYKIGVGDVILLSTPNAGDTVEALAGLLAAQTQRQGYTVQDDGAITIPDVGRIRLAGLSLEEAEAEIFQALVGRQIDPTFSIEIAEFNSQQVALGGAVRNPTSVAITLKPLTLNTALTAAGGLAVADRDYASIRLYRGGKLYQIPVTAYLSDPSIQTLALKDGDSIYVDTEFDLEKAQGYFAQQIQLANFRQSARQAALTQLETEIGLRRNELEEARENYLTRVELDSVERDYVYIAGEVGVQSRFTLPFERTASLADALFSQSEGVPNRTGNISELYVLRASNSGSGVTAWHLNALNAANLVLATKFELRPNDVVFVAEQPVTALDRLVSQLAPSIALARTL
ncbi:polysaccharide biosynthesis/export family protein [Sinisalibacter aestuarii]|nr:polysaccharide biosynthesis/export family protein [Sinisalibacter aestuarii]